MSRSLMHIYEFSLEAIIVIWGIIVLIVSGEWMFRVSGRPNGGDMVLLRALWTTTIVYIIVLLIIQGVDPERTAEFSIAEARLQVKVTVPWYGAIFAGVYALLYARFSSQWLYVKNLYNKIVEISIREFSNSEVTESIITEWKASFLADAQVMHLAAHREVAPIVKAWAASESVKNKFVTATRRGDQRWKAMMVNVERACVRNERRAFIW